MWIVMKRKRLLSWCALALLGLAACSTGDQPVERSSSNAEPAQMPQENGILLSAASPFEDLTEFAVAADASGMDRALAEIESSAQVVRSVLEPGPRERFDALMESLRAAREAEAYSDLALGSVEGYRVLVEGLHDEALVVPKAVSLLDYAGFRLSVLAGLESPDWASIQAATQEAREFWESLSGRVESTGLRDAMETTVNGLERAVATRDANMTAFAARIDLDLVDLLEAYFEDAASPGHGLR